eukprot:TRINITY_DN27222_c0_g1_i1.p1 TRINITY_DN27222_c0_g1~~TRINITY_DN27222_c0_g1_i1.p1  ORF type:complete len:540 (+),score=80.29 TRINITY_DN27222_c0_g1_i1:78-1697(+)
MLLLSPVPGALEEAAPPVSSTPSVGSQLAFQFSDFEARLFRRLDDHRDDVVKAIAERRPSVNPLSELGISRSNSVTQLECLSLASSLAERRPSDTPKPNDVLEKGRPARSSHVSAFGSMVPVVGGFESLVTEEELDIIRHEMEGDGMTDISKTYCQHIARVMVKARWMKHIVTAFIIGNAASIGAQVNWAVQHPRQQPPHAFDMIELAFLVIFAMELVLRLLAEARHFFSCENKHLRWNVLDVLLVSHGIIDIVMGYIWRDTMEVSVMRLVRIARLVRVVRVIRVMRFFRDLRIMIIGIVSTLKSLLWAILLLVIIIYSVSIVIMEIISGELDVSDAHDPDAVALQEQFGSLFQTMFLLFQSISGGVDWDIISTPLFQISVPLGIFYLAYVAFSLFCVLNIITGVFVENSAKISLKDEENLLLETIEGRRQRMYDLSSLFCLISGGQETFSRRQFQRHARDIRVQTQFSKLGISTHCLAGLFNLLDFQKTGAVSFDNFSMGIDMLHGSAKGIDLARLQSDVKAISLDIRALRRSCAGNS